MIGYHVNNDITLIDDNLSKINGNTVSAQYNIKLLNANLVTVFIFKVANNNDNKINNRPKPQTS